VTPLLEVDPERIEDQRDVLRAALEHVGVDPARTAWDRPRVRVVEPLAPGEERRSIGFHRDTWGSNLLAQVNWWAPIEPITAERTIAFYPAYWSRPIANSSAQWDLDEIRERRQAGEEVQIVPEPTEPVDTSSELRLVMEPGDLLCFSGAHLHASVPNTSGERRVSLELRTLNADDHEHGRGAPDLDGRAPRVPLHWFKSMDTGEPL
jgi:Phytanoyl-CoA dioxygenase (PhyH)